VAFCEISCDLVDRMPPISRRNDPRNYTKSHERTRANFVVLTFAAIILQGRLAIARGQFVTNQLSESDSWLNPLLRRPPLASYSNQR
jgi:hypothetical protein